MEIRDAYSPASFRANGHRAVDRLADYLEQALSRQLPKVLPTLDPSEALSHWPADFSAEPSADLIDLLERVLAESNHLHHPRYIGHQVTAPLPVATICEMVASLLNNGMAVFEMGPSASAMERSILQWAGGLFGFDSKAGGILTSGGSVGNLTALLAARQAKAGFDVWRDGSTGGPPLAVLVSQQAHYCIQRSVQIMGWGADGAIKVAVDQDFRLRADDLTRALAEAEEKGRRVIGVSASACSTATGSFDPLDRIAEFCAKHDLWMHVDAAHGGSAALSARHRSLLRGIEHADSVVWDAHKMLLMPALVTAVLFRNGKHAYQAFAQDASYLLPHPEQEEQWFNGALRTLECTKRMLSLKLYVALKICGTRMFSDYVDSTFDLAKRFADAVRQSDDFELPVTPQSNIVCFRYVGRRDVDLDRLQERLRRRLLDQGSFYIVQTALPSGLHLRVTIIHPMTTIDDLLALLKTIRHLAEDHATMADG